jgi:hypothetical protein
MDRVVRVKFFRIVGAARQTEAFVKRLRHLQTIADTHRVTDLDGVPFWVDKLSATGDTMTGRLCRRQSENLPPRAPAEGGLVPLGIPQIGHTTAWLFNSRYAVMAIEASRNGVRLKHLISYTRVMCDCAGYGFFPVTTDVNLERLRTGRIREFSVRLALPGNLKTASQHQIAVRAGMTELMAPGIAPLVEVTYASRLRDTDLQAGAFERLARWFRREKKQERGGIDTVNARIINADGDSVPLDLLDEVHLTDETELTLPDDNPDESHTIRARHLVRTFTKYQDDIHRQFG